MLDWSRFEARKRPFRHWICNEFLPVDTVREINDQWPAEWTKEDGKGQKKWNTTNLPPAARSVVDGIDPADVGRLVDISGLVADPTLGGGGLHCIPRGGFLKMHRDYNVHPTFGWHRRVNLLIYLNQNWRKDWGGQLQLGLESPRRVTPLAGRCVVFTMTPDSWHGHPEPLACPDDVQRRSLALYFYTVDPPAEPPHTTIYR